MSNEPETPDNSKYTDEQKIVAAVWVHERPYNNQTWEDICNNFRIRFKVAPPMRSTLMSWERKLFNSGTVKNKDKLGRPLARLMHVPYVKASLKENPHLSLRERAKDLGLPRTTLLKILQEDLNMEYEVTSDDSFNPNKKHAANNNGLWKKVDPMEGASTSGSGDDKQREESPLYDDFPSSIVEASLRESPNLSLLERAELLGLPESTLKFMMRTDIRVEISKEISPSKDKSPKKIKLETDSTFDECNN